MHSRALAIILESSCAAAQEDPKSPGRLLDDLSGWASELELSSNSKSSPGLLMTSSMESDVQFPAVPPSAQASARPHIVAQGRPGPQVGKQLANNAKEPLKFQAAPEAASGHQAAIPAYSGPVSSRRKTISRSARDLNKFTGRGNGEDNVEPSRQQVQHLGEMFRSPFVLTPCWNVAPQSRDT